MPKFTISIEPFGGKKAAHMINTKTDECAQILLGLGGSINSLVFLTEQGLLEVIDGYPTAHEALTESQKSFKGSSLFPFPNRLDGGQYRFNNQDYLLPVNFPAENNAIHGAVFDKQFDVVSSDCQKDHCSLKLQYIPRIRNTGYPFLYRLEQVYQLDDFSTLHCTTTVENLEKNPIPVGHGWHPYFKFGTKNGLVDELFLQFPAQKRLSMNDRHLPICAVENYDLFSSLKKIKQHHLDDCFCFLDLEETAVTTLSHPQLDICLQISQTTGKRGYNYCQIYTPPHRSSIAIEPMTCAPNAFNNGMGLIVLQPEERITLCWCVQLKKCSCLH